MHLFIQACILGLLAGGVYALMASGLTLAFGVMRVINVAQGAMSVLGAFLSYTLFTKLHIDPFVSVVLLPPLMFLVGVVLELVFTRPPRCPAWARGSSPAAPATRGHGCPRPSCSVGWAAWAVRSWPRCAWAWRTRSPRRGSPPPGPPPPSPSWRSRSCCAGRRGCSA